MVLTLGNVQNFRLVRACADPIALRDHPAAVPDFGPGYQTGLDFSLATTREVVQATETYKVLGRSMRIGLAWLLIGVTVDIRMALAQPAAIAGIGVSRCVAFNEQRAQTPGLEDYYFVWAQGFMSGVLLRAESGRDAAVDLVSPGLAPDQQRQFLRDYCARNPLRYFFHGVAALYNRLGGTSLDYLL